MKLNAFILRLCIWPPEIRKIIMIVNLATMLLVVSLVQVSAKGFSQISIHKKNASLASIFQSIEAQTDYVFFSKDYDLSKRGINIDVTDLPLEAVLESCFENLPLTYKVVDKTVVVRYTPTQVQALEPEEKRVIDIRGRVTGSNGEPLMGVSVRLTGSTTGTTTDENGRYTLTVPDNSGTLTFSYVGYEPQEIEIGGRSSIDVQLREDANALSEVVVTALGITRESKSLTYSTQNVDGEELTKATGVNVINGLQGKIAGLNITRSSGGVGAGSTVLLRGNRSITGNNAPLYVTDGVPGSIGMEDGDNIESITVLKGAAAAALYGSAGQNGVILITTKKGRPGVTAVQFNGGVMFDQADIHYDFQDEYAQGDAGVYSPSSEHSFGPKMTGQEVTLWNGSNVALAAQPNRFDDFFRTGVTYNNSLSVTTGSDKMQAYFSYGNIKAQGIMRNNDLTRHNLNLRITNTISKKLSLDTKLTYNNESVANSPNNYAITSIYRTPVSIPLTEMEEFEYTDEAGNQRQSYWKPGSSIIGNPFFYMYRNLNHRNVARVVGLFSAKYDFNSWLSLQVRGSVNQTFIRTENKTYADSYWSLVGSNYNLSQGDEINSNMDGLLTFNRDVTKDINLSGHIGGYIQGSTNKNTTSNANGLNKQNFFYLSNAKALQATNSFEQSPLIQSLYSSLTVSFRDYLYLDVTGRNDWSSALPEGEESVFYPSAGLTAIVSDIVTLPDWVSYGKVRVSSASSGYGGNAYLGQEYYTVGAGGVIITPTIKSPGNYKPELTTSFEAGLDWRFFKNRIGFDLTYYKTKTSNQLLLIGTPSATLFEQKYINAGLIENSGVELLVNATPVKIGKFSWNLMFNYSKNVNEVVRITDQMTEVIIGDGGVATVMVETGKPYGTLYVKGWQRDAQGRKLVDDLGRPLLTPGNIVYAGNANPNYLAGLVNDFRYGNFGLSFQLDYRNGGRLIAGTQPLIDADGHSKRSLLGREDGIVIDAYRTDGTKNDKVITSQQYFSAIGDRYPTGEEYTYSATNLRLREVVIDYTLPSELFNNNKYIKGIGVSVIGRNLLFLEKSTPFDPDIARGRGGGTEYVGLPFTRTFGVNLKANF